MEMIRSTATTLPFPILMNFLMGTVSPPARAMTFFFTHLANYITITLENDKIEQNDLKEDYLWHLMVYLQKQ